MKQTEEHIQKRIDSRNKNGNYKVSNETKQKLRNLRIGNKYLESTKIKMADSRKKYYINNPKAKIKLSETTKERYRNGFNPVLGKHWKQSESTLIKRRGTLNPAWKGGITPENHKIRASIEYLLWREAVFARDNWTCQKSGVKGGNLQAHHIHNFADFPELRTSIENGITLSRKSHKQFHKKYGRKNNTKKQLEEYLNFITL